MENFEMPQLMGESCWPNISEILSSVVTKIDHQQQAGSSELPLTGISTGFPEVDQLTLGLQPGELIVVAGRPGSGRYALSLKFIEHIAGTLGLPVVFHTLTNPIEEVGLRLLSSVSGVDSYRMRTGQLNDLEWKELSAGVARLHNAPLAIEANHRGDFESCAERTRQHAKHFGQPPGLIVIDEFQAFSSTGKHCSSGDARQEALYRLRELAVELAAPVIILSQLDARLDRRPDLNPCLSDLPRSGNIEAAADTILLLKRDYDYEFEELQPDENSRPCRIEIHEAKSRFDYLGRCIISLPKGAMSISLCWGTTNAP